MQEPIEQNNLNTIQIEKKAENQGKKDYQSPVCAQHKPLDHVRQITTVSLVTGL